MRELDDILDDIDEIEICIKKKGNSRDVEYYELHDELCSLRDELDFVKLHKE